MKTDNKVHALAAAVVEIRPTVVWATVAPSPHHRSVCCRSIDGKTPPPQRIYAATNLAAGETNLAYS